MSVGQSKGIRARQGKANRLIDQTNSIVSEYLTPHTHYTRFDAPKEPYIVSDAVRAMLKKQLPEDDVVSCTYTSTIQLDEPADTSFGDIEMQALAQIFAEEMERELFRQMTGGSNEYAESIRAAKIDVGQRNPFGKSRVIADLDNLT